MSYQYLKKIIPLNLSLLEHVMERLFSLYLVNLWTKSRAATFKMESFWHSFCVVLFISSDFIITKEM